MKLLGYEIKNVRSEDVTTDKKATGNYISEVQKFRQFETIKTLENAIATAQNITNPDREELNRIYDEIEQDPHFTSQWETRKMKTIQREFAIYDNDNSEEPNEQLTAIFNSAWFHHFMHEALDSKKRGFNLIEFGPWKDGKFTYYRDGKGKLHDPISHVNYDHVKPEFGILTKNSHDITGLDLFKPPVSNRTLFVGKPKSLGMLYKCAKYILFKNNCLSNWSEFAEVFGHDLRIGKTEAEGDQKKNFFNMLKKLGKGGFGIMDKEDEIEFAGTNRTDAYQVYKELNDYVDANISKLIFGQNVIGDMTGVTRGTAAENITDLYGEHDSKFLSGIINDELIPKMQAMGILSGNAVFKWDSSENLSLQEKSEVDLKISQMGVSIDPDYISETYGTRLIKPDEEGMNQDLPQIFEYHIENGIVNKNEVRQRLGLPPDNEIDKEELDAEISRKLTVMKDARAAGIALEDAARLAGFDEAEISKIVETAKESMQQNNPRIANPEQVANALKKLYDSGRKK